MPRGGHRPGAGRPRKNTKGISAKPKAPAVPPSLQPKQPNQTPTVATPKAEALTPLEYMLSVMNNMEMDEARRDRMAVAAAPFVHAKAGESGKKEEKAAAARKAGAGRFAPAAPPKLSTSAKAH